MGRPRKPDHLKLVSGTAQPSRMNPNAPSSDLVRLKAPSWLSKDAVEIFDELAGILFELHVSQIGDGGMLALLAIRMLEVRVTTGVLEDLGMVYAVTKPSGEKLMKRRPEVAMRSDAIRHCQSLMREFGLSPAARGRVTACAGTAKTNPFSEFNL